MLSAYRAHTIIRTSARIQILLEFTSNVTNYVGVTSDDTAALRAASPAYLADSSTAPLFLVNSSQDPMPFSQLADMTTKLDAHGRDELPALTIPGSQHAFGYWGTVKDQAIAFLAFLVRARPSSSASNA